MTEQPTGLKANLDFNETVTPTDNFLSTLKNKLPQFFTADKYDEETGELTEAGTFDFPKFKTALKENNVSDELSSGYRLDFTGKNLAKKQAGERPTTVIVPNKEHNDKPENKDSKNLFFTGDNLEVLRHLQSNYQNAVDFIYIDPPYNTGSDGFVYPDDFKYSDEQLKSMFALDDEGVKRLKSIQGRSSHSAWLAFMYPRLVLARKLLKETGVIFVSIDDNEQANLKLLMDEVFGEGNFVKELPTIMNLKGNQDEFAFAGTHEYTEIYAKNIGKFIPYELPVDEESAATDWIEDENGFYKKGAGLVSTGQNSPRTHRPALWYPIIVNEDLEISLPTVEEVAKLYDKETKTFNDEFAQNLKEKYETAGVVTIWPTVNGREASWRWGYESVKNKPDEIIVSRTRNGITLNKKQRPQIGDMPTAKPKTLFYKPEYSSGNGTRELKEYLEEERIFSNPKPLQLIKDFLQIGGTQDSLILDFFAGSATTADAVLQLNAEYGGNRRFMMVQLPEILKEDSVAYKAGYKTIDEISRTRIEKAAEKIKAENPDYTGDLGFKHFTVKEVEVNTLDKMIDFDPNALLVEDLIAELDGGVDTLLTTWLTADGYKFDEKVETVKFDGHSAYLLSNGLLYIIEKGWSAKATEELVNAIGTRKLSINTIIVSEYALGFSDMTELKTNVKNISEPKVRVEVRG
ncbi:DNA methylase, restriction system type III (plasmid) [Lactococcus cremoris subsp. cremoris A76]|uniref:site-specific DNA-methyltransferase n=1 Tax=Lactococcus lactis subsp. cremoris TaxID=1359 RepID=UPI000238CF96|nr:site-specific DNA-methyltransferase [Lactococcus cremoris]AEU41942.1 DNA methylase, restriction system type III [Lactococcus cremoris subsp. cremoris A76]